jgi:hypothetical protein
MSVRLVEALHALLAATPEPPGADTDPSEVLTQAQEMAAARVAPLEALAAMIEADPTLADAGGELAEQLKQRDTRWAALLVRAHQELKQRVAAIGQSRRK